MAREIDHRRRSLSTRERIALVNGIGRYEGRVLLAPLARGNLQIHWPKGNVIIRRSVTEPHSHVPDYNAEVAVERVL